jgi:hypothetical protein
MYFFIKLNPLIELCCWHVLKPVSELVKLSKLKLDIKFYEGFGSGFKITLEF